MRVTGVLSALLLGTGIVIVQPVATALTPSEIAAVAQQITVRIDGANTGSGVIIERQGNVYTVVTNWHVVQLKGNYTVQTPDGQKYTFNNSQVKRFPGVDLAVFQFTSNQNYSVAEKGNSDQITLNTNISVAGYPAGIGNVPGRNFTILSTSLSSRVEQPKDGYALVYTVQAFDGMSGGAILDEQGKLVGIHGRAGSASSGGTATLGIPLRTYLSLAPSAPPVVTAPAPKPPVSTTPNAKPRNSPFVTAPSAAQFTLVKTLIGHSQKVRNIGSDYSYKEGMVWSVAFSPDGKTLASASVDKTIKIWSTSTGKEVRTLNGHSATVRAVAISPDGKTLASGSMDKTIKIWNISTGQVIRTLNSYSDVESIAISPDSKTLVSGHFANTIKIWNFTTGKEINTLKGHSAPVFSVAISPDSKTLVSSSGYKNNIKIWNLSTGQEIHTINVHFNRYSYDVKSVAVDVDDVKSVAISPDGRTLASGSGDKTIKIWNISTGQEIGTLKGHSNQVYSVAISPDGKTLASGSYDKTIKLWNMATGKEIRTLNGHSSGVTSVAFSPDGKTLASGSRDATIKIWRLSE